MLRASNSSAATRFDPLFTFHTQYDGHANHTRSNFSEHGNHVSTTLGLTLRYERKLAPVSLEGEAIKVAVGSNEAVAFVVHEALIPGSSDFFDKAMGSDWKEAAERVIKLLEDKPIIFRLYLPILRCYSHQDPNSEIR